MYLKEEMPHGTLIPVHVIFKTFLIIADQLKLIKIPPAPSDGCLLEMQNNICSLVSLAGLRCSVDLKEHFDSRDYRRTGISGRRQRLRGSEEIRTRIINHVEALAD